jgi:hypothetical protein
MTNPQDVLREAEEWEFMYDRIELPNLDWNQHDNDVMLRGAAQVRALTSALRTTLEAKATAEAALAVREEQVRWREVSEELPKFYGRYRIVCAGFERHAWYGWNEDGEWYSHAFGTGEKLLFVTHWQGIEIPRTKFNITKQEGTPDATQV